MIYYNLSKLREADEVDAQVLDVVKEVSEFYFPGDGKPGQDTALAGLKDIVTDTWFSAVGSLTARKIAQKVKSIFFCPDMAAWSSRVVSACQQGDWSYG
jgi:hypothetical protein